MIIYLISYGIHVLVAVLFFILIPLPFLIRGTVDEKKKAHPPLKNI